MEFGQSLSCHPSARGAPVLLLVGTDAGRQSCWLALALPPWTLLGAGVVWFCWLSKEEHLFFCCCCCSSFSSSSFPPLPEIAVDTDFRCQSQL